MQKLKKNDGHIHFFAVLRRIRDFADYRRYYYRLLRFS